MKKLGYLFLLGGVLSLLTVLLAAKDWWVFITNAQQPTRRSQDRSKGIR